MSKITKAYIFQPNESERRWMGKTSTSFLATGALTGGEFALVEERSIKGISVPLHKHDEDTESFYILEGEVSFFLNDGPGVRALAGAFVHIPKGAVHGFRVESDAVRYLILTTPHHAEFYREITLPEPGASVDDAAIGKACKKYNVDFIGPLPA